jgi:uncharacterized integral membrane protein
MYKIILGILFSFLLLILILQNLQLVKLNFLLWSFESSLAIVIIITFILSTIIGLFFALPYAVKKVIKNKKEDKLPIK